MNTPHWAVGMRRLRPGVYLDSQPAIHFDVREMCAEAGYPYTQANAEMLEQVARRAVKQVFGDIQIIDVTEEP